MDEDLAHQFELLSVYKSNLHKTEIQAAQYGADVPIKIQNDISFYRIRISEIDNIINTHNIKDANKEREKTECLTRIYYELLQNFKVYKKAPKRTKFPEDIPVSKRDYYKNIIVHLVSHSDFPIFLNTEWSKVYKVVVDSLGIEDLEWVATMYRYIREAEDAHNALLKKENDTSGILSDYEWYNTILKMMDIYFDITLDTLHDILSDRGVDVKSRY